MIDILARYRAKALESEARGREATNPAIKGAWIETAIESQALANRTAK